MAKIKYESSIMLARHAGALQVADRFAASMRLAKTKYIVIIVDGPESIGERKLSYVSDFPKQDVALICERISDTLK